MTHQFSLNIHGYLAEKIKSVESQRELAKNQQNLSAELYCEGQLQELTEIRSILTSKFDLDTQTYY